MSSDPSRNEAERLTFLRTDLNFLKSEIARRSGLQERALALYLAVVAFATIRVAAAEGLLLAVPAVWTAAWLTTVFWAREHLEIVRLAGVVRDRVATPAASILGCHPGALVPSEVWEGDEGIDSHTRSLHRQFQWIALVVIPSILTVVALGTRPVAISKRYHLKEPHVWLALVSVAAGVHIVCVLRGTRARESGVAR